MAALVPRCPVGLRLLSSRFSHRAATGSEFRSAYSLEQLYPARDGGSSGHTAQPQPAALSIPMVNTKAEVRFHLATADWIPEAVREKMASMHRNKINRAGELIVNSDQSRYQMRNLAICLEKIRVMVTEATEKPKVVSKETTQQLIARVEKMNRERLRQKKIHSNIKQSRKADFD
ncbi:peptidyl-tRNA hydrolase ICT1, mitochondrial isoform X2 [Coturnix japonica]|uniref:peptidyl-tRNA hydrolase ICT1, mitochondrial isoform X2 n=1 Tax=Coturnix japonica TaxID=93934 RepID=UPI00077813B7|nr:peptidyl-tRNA hydrolase ICT1, mitochondrial isoform X2 [Coturnix japonica]